LLTSIDVISSVRTAGETLAPGIGTASAAILNMVNAEITALLEVCLLEDNFNDDERLISVQREE